MSQNKRGIILIFIGCIITIVFVHTFYVFLTPQPSEDDYFIDLEVGPLNASYIVVGASYIKVLPKAKVVTQVDR